jgi:hypothetical protein
MTVPRVVSAVALFAGVYALSQPFVEFGRFELGTRYGSIVSSSLSERLEIASKYESEITRDPFEEQLQSGLIRLSYVNAGGFAISLYDSGNSGPSLDNVLATLVPRYFWKDKPVVTDIGTLFNLMATGNPNSSSAPGYFADAYWALGWKGIPLTMIPLGLSFALLSRFGISVLERGRWLFFPVVLLAMKMGFRVDGYLVSDFVGSMVVLFWAYVGLLLIERPVNALLRGWRRPRRRTGAASTMSRGHSG